MSILVDGIDRAVQELRSLLALLDQYGTGQLHEETDPEKVRELKNLLDDARHLVWPILLADEQRAGAATESVIHRYRMHRVREMVQAVRESHFRHDPATTLFMAEIRRLAETRPN